MKFNYYPETDSLYIELSSSPSVDSKEVGDGLVIDFDNAGKVVGIDINHASLNANLNKFEIQGFTFGKTVPEVRV